MKAKEYAARYRDAEDRKKELIVIARDFLIESKTMVKQRNATTDPALYSILNELDSKWKAFAREFPYELRQDGFELLVKDQLPEVHFFWTKYNRDITQRRT